MSLLDRCLQLGAIAKTVDHLLSLVRVIQTEVSPAPLSIDIRITTAETAAWNE